MVLLDAETLVQVGVLFEEYYGVGPMDFSPDGRLLALGVGDGAFSLWDVQSTEKRRRFGEISLYVNRADAVAFSFDGRLLATLDTTDLIVRDLETWQIIFSQRGYYREGRRTRELLSTSDNRFIAIDSLEDDAEAGIIHPEGGIILWDVLTGTDLIQLKGEKKQYTWQNLFTISPDGRVLAAVIGQAIQLWDLRTGATLRTLKASKEPLGVSSLAFCPDSSTLAAASPKACASVNSVWRMIAPGVVRLWDIQTGALLKTLEGQRSGASNEDWVTFSPDGKTVALSGRGLKLWDLPSGREKATLPPGHDDRVHGVAFQPNGQLISGSVRRIIHWDLPTAKPLKIIEGRFSDRNDSTGDLSPNGELLAVSGSDATITVWDAHTGTRIQNLKGHTQHISSVMFSSDSKWLAAGSERESLPVGYEEPAAYGDATILIWDVGSGAVKHRFTVSGTIGDGDLAFSPDGKRFAASISSGLYDVPGVVQWWDMETGWLLQTVPNPGSGVLAFSPNGALLATQGFGARNPVNNIQPDTIRLWDVTTGALHRTWQLPEESGRLNSLAFHPNGKILASGASGWPHATIQLWDVRTGAELRRLLGQGRPRTLVFSPDGQYLVVGGLLMVWNLNAVLSPDFSIDPLVEGPLLPETFAPTALFQSYPNPFHPPGSRCGVGLRIPFLLGADGVVTLTIYDVGGRRVRQFSLGHRFAGDYRFPPRSVSWDGRNDVGEAVASGIYFYTLEAGTFRSTRKLVLKK